MYEVYLNRINIKKFSLFFTYKHRTSIKSQTLYVL